MITKVFILRNILSDVLLVLTSKDITFARPYLVRYKADFCVLYIPEKLIRYTFIFSQVWRVLKRSKARFWPSQFVHQQGFTQNFICPQVTCFDHNFFVIGPILVILAATVSSRNVFSIFWVKNWSQLTELAILLK